MAQTIKLKNSGTSGNTPSSLVHGELALNYADGKLFYKNSSNNIVELVTGGSSFSGSYNDLTDVPFTYNNITGVSTNADLGIIFHTGGTALQADAHAELTFNPSSNLLKVGGDVTITGSYTADTHFKSSDGNVTLSATGGGGVYLRPDGSTSSTTQLYIQSGTGNAEFSGTISSGAITADTGGASQNVLNIGGSSATNYTIQRWLTSAHSGNEAYILAYGASHSSEAGNFAIKNLEANSDIFFELAGSVEPLRLTSTGATFAGSVNISGDLNIASTLAHTGDLDTYFQFNAANTARIVVGGSQKLVINTNGAQISNGTLTVATTSTNGILVSGNTGGLNFTGGNNRIYFGGQRALEGVTSSGNIQIGEGFSGNLLLQMATEVQGQLSVTDGSTSAPAIRFSSDADTGICRTGTDELRIVTGGGIRGTFSSAGIFSSANVYSGTTGSYRNFSGTWAGTTGTANNGFYFLNTANSNTTKAMELSHDGNVVFAGTLTAASNINTTSGGYQIGGTTVIDASRALVSINSITTGGNVNTTSGGFQINGATVIGSNFRITPFEHVIFGSTTGYIQHPSNSSANAWAYGVSGGGANPGVDRNKWGLHYYNGTSWSNPFHVDTSGNAVFTGEIQGATLDINGNADITGQTVIVGTGTTSSTIPLQIKDNNATNIFTVRDDGVVLVQKNYLYVTSAGGAYVQHSLRARGGITNDGGNTLSISSGSSDINFNNKNLVSVGAITANADDNALTIKSPTNGTGVEIKFSDNTSGSQNGFIEYRHADGQSYGGSDVFTIKSDQTALRVLADGLLMFKSGLALKPATGTGAGTTLITSGRALQNITSISCSGEITASDLTITGGSDGEDIYINNTSPTLGFTDSNSFSDSNDVYLIRGASTGKLQFQFKDDSAGTTTQTFLIDQSGNTDIAGNTEISGTLTVSTAGSSIKSPLYMGAQNSTGEGGEITLSGSNSNTGHTLDTVNGSFRIFDNNGTLLSGNSGYGLSVVNGYRVNGTQVITSSRNLTNIGTISSGAITSSGQILTTIESSTAIKSRFIMGKASGSTANGNLYLQYGSSDTVFIGAGSGGAGLDIAGTLKTGRTGINTAPVSDVQLKIKTSTNDSTDFAIEAQSDNGSSLFSLDGAGEVRLAGNVKMSGTTIITSGRGLTNLTLSHGTGGTRFETNNWHYSTDNNARFYFEASGRTFYKASAHQFRNSSNATQFNINTNGHIHIASNGDSGASSTEYIKAGGVAILTSSRVLQNVSGDISMFTNDSNYATQTYVTNAISDLVDSAPSTLDTLNELASALNDDANFSTTVTNSIATKLPLAGGTLTGTLNSKAINMQNHQLYGVNNLRFNDPGVNEGIKWDGGNQWQIYESPDDQSNNSGNLQFTSGSGGGTRRLTLTTGGHLNLVTGDLRIGGTSVITSGKVLQNVTGNISMFTNNSGYITNSTASLDASKITSGTLSNSRLSTDMILSGGAPRYRLTETGVTNTPNWWMVADGGNYSIRLNNTGTYPLTIVTNTDNNAVTSLNLGYSTHVQGAITNTSTISAGSTIHRGNMTIDSQEIDVSSGDLALDVAGNITLDAGGGNIDLKEGGTTFGRLQEMIGGLGISAGSTPTFAQLISSTKTLFFGHIELGDSKHVRWGNGNGDLQIFHDGSNSYIEEYGTGDLIISSSVLRPRTDSFILNNAANTEHLIIATADGAVDLYHNGVKKLNTKSDGVDITGELQSDSLDVDGAVDIDGNTVITGSSGTGFALEVERGDNSADVLLAYNNGVVQTPNNYLYASRTGGASFYSESAAVFRGGILNDQSGQALTVSDALNVTGDISSNTTVIFQASGRVLQNVSGNISMFTNDSGYITSASLPTVNNGTLTLATSGTGLSGSASFTANQSGNSTYTVTLTSAENGASKILRTQSNGYLNILNWINVGSTGLFSGTIGNHFHVETNGWISKSGNSNASHIRMRTYDNNTRGFLYANSSNYIGFLDPNQNWIFQARSNGNLYKGNGTGLIWHSANDGSGSGLDADTLDGQHASAFLTSESDTLATVVSRGDTTTATTKLRGGGSHLGNHEFAASSTSTGYATAAIELRESQYTANGSATPPQIGFHWGGIVASNIAIDSGGAITIRNNPGNAFEDFRADNIYASGTNAVMHVGNDGSGSGYDADTVDGIHGSSFLRSDATDSVSGNFVTTLQKLQFNGVGSNSNNANASYAIYQEAGAWSHPYPDLIIGYHTGIKMGGHTSYGGVRFYNNNPTSGSIIASIGDGDQNFRGYHNGFLRHGGSTDHKIMTVGNDGSGSGFDADLLDGQHGSYYAPASSIPTVGNGTITINAGSNMSGGGTFTVNQSGNTTITLNSTASGGGGASSSQTVTARVKANRLDYIAATSPATIFTATSGKVIVLEEAICFIDADAVSASGYPVFGYPIRVRVKSQWNNSSDAYIHRDGGMTFTKEALNSLFRSNSQSANYSANMKRFLVAQPRDPTANNPDQQQQIAEVNSSDGTFNSKIELTMDSYVNTSTSEDYYFYFQVKFREVTLSDITGASGMVTI